MQDFLSSADIRSSDMHLAVKSARTHNRRIQNIHPVRRSHYNNPFVNAKAVHFHQHLIQCLFPLVMSAAHTSTATSGNRVDLIDKYDTRRIFLGVFKQVTYPGRSDTDKHFYKIRSGNAKKRYACLSCNRFCKQRLTSSRRPYQQYAFWYSGAQLCIFGRFPKKIHNFLQLFFFFFQSGYFREIDRFGFICVHSGPAFAKIHHFRAAASACGLIDIIHDNKQNEHCSENNQIRQPGRQPAGPRNIFQQVIMKCVLF